MTNFLLLNTLLLIAGVYFLVRNIRLLRSESALRAYMESSPKAAFWVNKYGLEGAMKMARESFIPFGVVIALGLVGLSGWNFWRVYG